MAQQRGTGKESIWTRHASVIIRNAQRVRDGSHHNAVLINKMYEYAAGYATASLNWNAADVAAAAAQARCWFRAAEVVTFYDKELTESVLQDMMKWRGVAEGVVGRVRRYVRHGERDVFDVPEGGSQQGQDPEEEGWDQPPPQPPPQPQPQQQQGQQPRWSSAGQLQHEQPAQQQQQQQSHAMVRDHWQQWQEQQQQQQLEHALAQVTQAQLRANWQRGAGQQSVGQQSGDQQSVGQQNVGQRSGVQQTARQQSGGQQSGGQQSGGQRNAGQQRGGQQSAGQQSGGQQGGGQRRANQEQSADTGSPKGVETPAQKRRRQESDFCRHHFL